jgi:hypothetical protein
MILTGKINGFGDAWYHPDQVANIFEFSSLEDQCRITYDSNVEKAFNVHTNDAIVKFKRNVDGLYVYQPSKAYLSEVANGNQVTGPKIETNMMVQTVNGKKKVTANGNSRTLRWRESCIISLDVPLLKTLRLY